MRRMTKRKQNRNGRKLWGVCLNQIQSQSRPIFHSMIQLKKRRLRRSKKQAIERGKCQREMRGMRKAQKEQETGNRKRKMSKGNERDEEDSEHKDHEEDDEEVEVEQEREEGERGEQTTPAGGGTSPGGSQVVPQKTVFQVTCGVIDGMLHKDRFASGTCGKSIRTELSWMTPMEFLMEGSVMAETSWKKDILCDGNPLSVLIKNKDLIMHPLLCDCKLCKTGDLQDQIKDDDCFICRSQGNLICCEECPRSFHQGCHLPNLNNAMLRKDLHWVCTFCILRNSQSWRQPSKKTYQEVLNYRTSEHLLECQYLLLCLYHTDEDQIFVKNPCIKVALPVPGGLPRARWTSPSQVVFPGQDGSVRAKWSSTGQVVLSGPDGSPRARWSCPGQLVLPGPGGSPKA
uniref:PHD-type domain-containing protein n=1 Tax=Esox lucius TaxID=8010 RepID=A0A6Q2ZBB6_ESOLU